MTVIPILIFIILEFKLEIVISYLFFNSYFSAESRLVYSLSFETYSSILTILSEECFSFIS